MEVNDNASKLLFEFRADIHGDSNAVLDAGNTKEAKNSNILHDYFSKKYVLKCLRVNKKNAVLDFGCGVGRLTFFLESKVEKIVGYDFSPKMIQIARKENNRIHFTTDINTLNQFQFDIVFTHWVLAHMNDQTIVSTFSNLKTLINSNGKVGIFEQTLLTGQDNPSNEIYKRRSEKEYEMLFNQAGFELKKVKKLYRTPSYSRHFWNKSPFKFKWILPVLYLIERGTLNYKIQNIEYYTTYMEFQIKDFI